MSALSVPSCLPDCTLPLLPLLRMLLPIPLPPWAPPVLIGVGVCRSTCLQIMFIHVYKPLTCTGRRTWLSSTGNWETLAWACGRIESGPESQSGSGCSSGSAHRGVPWHQRQRHQRIDSALAFWLFGWVTRCRRHSRCVGATTPTPTPNPTPSPSPSPAWTRLGFGFEFGFVALSTLIC